MTKLEELIEKLCPDGVEYVKLGDVCDIKGRIGFRGYTRQDQVEQGNGAISLSPSNIIDGNIVYDNCTYITWEKYEESPEIKANTGDIIFCKTASVGKTALIKELPEKATINPQLVLINNIKCNNSFLSYVLKGKDFQNKVSKIKGLGTIPTISQKDFYNLTIPLPPLPVQEEIVRILNKFTSLTAELQARKTQYEYYRDKLLTFGDNVPRVKLGDIGTDFYRGSGIKKDEVTADGIQCIRYGEIYTKYGISFDKCISHTNESIISSPKYMDYGDILFAITGESVEDIAKSTAYTGKERCLVGGDIVVMKHNQNPKYLSYALSTQDAIRQKGQGKVKSKVVHSNVPSIKAIEIPLPSLAEQQRIVAILDRFDKLCNDITTGLPAEIEARQKQYEYYRDKLLTFKRKEE